MSEIRLERVYDILKADEAAQGKRADDGTTYRVLVDRLWPRGVKKESLHIDEWAKDIAPSTELREKFHHHEDKWDEFVQAYREQLESSTGPQELVKRVGSTPLVLLVASKDPAHSNGAVLQDYLGDLQK